MGISKLLVAAVCLSCVVGSSWAKTPDRLTPSVETICDEYRDSKGPSFGLCNAYCEAMDCGDPRQHAANRACTRVNDNFEKHTGYRLPEGFNDIDDNGDPINNCLVDDECDDVECDIL